MHSNKISVKISNENLVLINNVISLLDMLPAGDQTEIGEKVDTIEIDYLSEDESENVF